MSAAPVLIALVALALGAVGLRDFLRPGGDADLAAQLDGPGGKLKGAKEGRSDSFAAGSQREQWDPLGLGERIRLAGLEKVLVPRTVMALKGCGAAFGLLFGSLFTGILPGRLAPLVLAATAAALFMLPDLLLARAGKKRHRQMVVALPDLLDLLSVSVQTGRGLGGCLVELSETGRGPLTAEMARTGDDMAWGSGQAAALDGLRRRVGGPEITAFCSTLERSRRLGSPLADQLRRQSATLRQDQRRAIEEEAARAAPKIQLVIALVLVPSVLLLIVAALAANADTLLNTGY